MKYKFTNLNNARKLSVEVTHNSQRVTFVVKTVLDKIKRFNLGSDYQFEILESYLDKMGQDFKDELFDRYDDFSSLDFDLSVDLRESITTKALGLLSMFNVEHMYEHVKSKAYVIPPSNLKDRFDENILINGMGTRVQTYLKDEYLWLVALATISKAVIGPFAETAYANPSIVIGATKELSLIQLILRAHHIFKSPPAVKLLGGFERVVETNTRTQDRKSVVMKKMTAISDLPTWMLGLAFFKVMPVSIAYNDNHATNLITSIYRYTTGVIKPDTQLRNKTPPGNNDESESTLEIYRMSTELMVAVPEEFKYFLSKPEDLLHFYGIVDKDGVMRDALRFLSPLLRSYEISPSVVKIVSWVIGITPITMSETIGIIDPESIAYLDITSLINALALAFCVAHYYGLHDISLILATTTSVGEGSIQTERNEKIPKGILNELTVLYPIQRMSSTDKVPPTNEVVDAITELSSDLYKENLWCLATRKYLGNREKTIMFSSDLRGSLARLVVMLHKGKNDA